jgi:hypothetical protein
MASEPVSDVLSLYLSGVAHTDDLKPKVIAGTYWDARRLPVDRIRSACGPLLVRIWSAFSPRVVRFRARCPRVTGADRISVDLHGLKALLLERAQALGVSPSDLVRKALADELGRSAGNMTEPSEQRTGGPTDERARLCLRMGSDESAATLAAARRAGMSTGRYVAHLVAGVPAILEGGRYADHVAALIAANAELSTLSRNIHHLTHLLRQGDVVPALAYREMLNTLDGDIRRHLALAAGALADLRPRSHQTRPAQRRTL